MSLNCKTTRKFDVWVVLVYQCTSTTSLSYTEGDTCSSKLSYLLFPRSSTTSLKRLSLPLTFGLFLIGSLMKLVSPPWIWIVMIRYHLKHLQCFKNAGMQSVTKELMQLKVSPQNNLNFHYFFQNFIHYCDTNTSLSNSCGFSFNCPCLKVTKRESGCSQFKANLRWFLRRKKLSKVF